MSFRRRGEAAHIPPPKGSSCGLPRISSANGRYRMSLLISGKKFPNKFKNPNPSTNNPHTGHPAKMTRNAPIRNVEVARRRARCEKYATVRLGPIMRGSPARKRRFPRRRRPVLKNIVTPSMVTRRPLADRLRPSPVPRRGPTNVRWAGGTCQEHLKHI